jgi:hypothetical protein
MQIAQAILLVWTTSAAFQSESGKLVRVAGPGYDGAVVAGDVQMQSDPRHLRRPEQVWTPTVGDLRDAESRLPEYLNSRQAAAVVGRSKIRSELGQYRRQYLGAVRRNQRDLLIRFFHQDTAVVRSGLWLRDIVVVAGGGDRYFQITYRIQDKRFTGLHINALE